MYTICRKISRIQTCKNVEYSTSENSTKNIKWATHILLSRCRHTTNNIDTDSYERQNKQQTRTKKTPTAHVTTRPVIYANQATLNQAQ